ncbi:hypothetical protein N7516_001723 [Penicillium verrucosum]|uniref:uncharacterized protein n=1 Tax=Penicillium verrucosum TaxID=60171 RepID=UPI002545692D|nr:uncharacterized protein N7516_001723 [Penicillium verrucosum]KAJ5941555.1 hypothetical protein N7516_001723 [Penicillium verrucosum]
MAAGGFSTLFMILITVFMIPDRPSIYVSPLGVFMLGGCGVDFWINMLLALVGYFPAHVHAIYLEYVYIDRRGRDPLTRASLQRAPFVFSDRIQNGGHRRTSAGRTHGTE